MRNSLIPGVNNHQFVNEHEVTGITSCQCQAVIYRYGCNLGIFYADRAAQSSSVCYQLCVNHSTWFIKRQASAGKVIKHALCCGF